MVRIQSTRLAKYALIGLALAVCGAHVGAFFFVPKFGIPATYTGRTFLLNFPGGQARGSTTSHSPASNQIRASLAEPIEGPLQRESKLQEASTYVRGRVSDIREDLQERTHKIQDRVAEVSSALNEDYISPLKHVIQNPSSIHYGAAMSVRLSYFMAQQTVVSSTLNGKRMVDVVAVARAVLAALADGREEDLLHALRIPEDRITSTENYAWWSANLKGIVDLLRKEARSIEDGVYRLPYDMKFTQPAKLWQYNPANMMMAFAAYYKQELNLKREEATAPVETAHPESKFSAPGRYPAYFTADDGFLTAQKARLMDYEMESQVWGMGDAMHRRALVRVSQVLADKDPTDATILDVGCGTGRFLTFVKDNFKHLNAVGLDLSLFNLQRARSSLAPYGGASFVEANAEQMPLQSESMDVVTCNFVLSRMPIDAQVSAINEMARVVKPGGKVVITDGSQPEFDGADVCTFDRLPTWHPSATYSEYLRSDLEYALIKAGLFVQDKEINWVSKVLVAQKPPVVSASGSDSGTGLMGVGF